MPDYQSIVGFTGKRGPNTYKPAKGASGKGNFSNIGHKPAHKSRINKVDKKVKRVSNKVMRYHSKNPGSAAQNHMGVI